MHIGAVSYFYHPIINGVVLTIDDWKNEAARYGISYTVIAPRHEGEPDEKHVVRFPAIPILPKFGVTIPWFPRIFVEKILKNRPVDIIHIQHPFFLGGMALYLGKQLAIPVVFSYHTRYSDYVKTYIPFLPARLVDAYVDRSVVSFMNQCHMVTVSTQSLKRELKKKGVRVPMAIVPLGVDTKRFAGVNGKKVRRSLGLKSTDVLLLSMTRIAKEKNIFFLLAAAAEVLKKNSDVHVCWVGSGTEEKLLTKRIQHLGLSRRMHVVGARSYEDIPSYLAASDIFISASETETFGRVYVEAMAAGLPVVTVASQAAFDILKHGKTGIIVENKTPKEFARAVGDLLTDRSRRMALGGAAKKAATREFDVKRTFSMLLRVYKKIL